MYLSGNIWICNGQDFLVSGVILEVSPVICLVVWEVGIICDTVMSVSNGMDEY